jgi:hypothetical protein
MRVIHNTAPTQFTGGKTQKELAQIYKQVLVYEGRECEDDIIPFHIICTNNSFLCEEINRQF